MSNPALVRAMNLTSYRTETISGISFYVAENADQHATGLSGLSSLDKDGMLFVFDTPTTKPFHMANMELDLDIAFYDEEGKLLKVGSFSKHYKGPIFSPSAYKYVVETPQTAVNFSDLDLQSYVS